MRALSRTTFVSRGQSSVWRKLRKLAPVAEFFCRLHDTHAVSRTPMARVSVNRCPRAAGRVITVGVPLAGHAYDVVWFEVPAAFVHVDERTSPGGLPPFNVFQKFAAFDFQPREQPFAVSVAEAFVCEPHGAEPTVDRPTLILCSVRRRSRIRTSVCCGLLASHSLIIATTPLSSFVGRPLVSRSTR